MTQHTPSAEHTRFLADSTGRIVRLTAERPRRIMGHPEMAGQEPRVGETILGPDVVVASARQPTIHLFHKFYEHTPVSPKYLLVAVKSLDDDSFVITAFFH